MGWWCIYPIFETLLAINFTFKSKKNICQTFDSMRQKEIRTDCLYIISIFIAKGGSDKSPW